MTVPVVIFYIVGLVLFILGIEEEPKKETAIIYLGLAFFTSYMGYSLSYTSTDYTEAAYFPLVSWIFSVIMLIYKAWQLLPQ